MKGKWGTRIAAALATITLTIGAAGAAHAATPEALRGTDGINAGDLANLPTSVDLRPRMPRIAWQGDTASCTAFALVYSIGTYWAGQQLDPFTTYRETLEWATSEGRGEYTKTSGTNLLDALDIIDRNGAAALNNTKDWDRTAHNNWDAPRATPTIGEFQRATWLRTIHNKDVTRAGTQNAIKAHLAAGHPILFNIRHGKEADDTSRDLDTPMAPVASDANYYHAVAAVGYNETGVIIKNSWGNWWGANGYGLIEWNDLDQRLVEAVVPMGWKPHDG